MSRFRIPLFIFCALVFAAQTRAEDSNWLDIGVRASFAGRVNGEDFNQWEITTTYRLPWSWGLDSGWAVDTLLNASIGVIDAAGETAAIVSLGPGLAFVGPGGKFSIEAGISPTLISEDEYGDADLGSNAQFTSFIGLGYRLNPHTTLSGRVQHMSNAGIGSPNPGLNQCAITISYRF